MRREDLGNTVPFRMPPWTGPGEWPEANQTVDCLTRLRASNLGDARRRAETISAGLKSLFPVLDELCAATCGYCPEPCCMVATVWFDFRDLIFMRLAVGQTPPGQLMDGTGRLCRYFGPKGCILPRIQRPWVCTLYLCPAQASRLRKMPESVRNGFHENIRCIKACRLKMEDDFISAIV